MSYQQISSPPAEQAEVQVNENMAALGQAFLWSHDVTADTGLTVGFNGGTFNGNTVADTTLACDDDATNYIVAHRTTRVLSDSTGTTNWNDTGVYGRVARAVFASGALTFHDERFSEGGIFDHGSAAGATTADDVTIADSSSVFAGSTVEEALEELALAASPFDVHVFYPGEPTTSALVLRIPVARAVTFPDDFAGSYGTALTAADASTDFDVQVNDVSVGTITFALGADTATFVTAAGTVVLAAGDTLSIIAPASPDADLADVGFVLAGTR